MNLNSRNLVKLLSLIWFLANPYMWMASLIILLDCFAIHEVKQTVAVGVIKAVNKKAAVAGKVTKSA